MQMFLRSALLLSLLGVAACDDVALSGDPAAQADVRGQKSCVSAVAKHTKSAAKLNTTIPIVETNRFIVDVPNAAPWTCLTDETGKATQIVERKNG